MTEEPIEPERPEPLPPEIFGDARRAVFRHWAPRVAGVLVAVAVALLLAQTWMPLTAARVLAVVGLGLDICGVWILAHAALASPEELAWINTHRWMSGGARRSAVHTPAEGLAGVWLAAVGFVPQLVGNLLPS